MAYGGQYNLTDPPQRSGVFINTRTVVAPRSRAGSAGVVGVVGQADWGPDNEIVNLSSSGEALGYYGSSGSLYFAVDQALAGEGLPDRAGASTVKAYRITGSGRAKATASLSNGTGAALQLTAKYNGTRANNFIITTQTNPVDTSKRDLIIYEGTSPRESYTYDSTGSTLMAELVADINKRSALVTAAVLLDGVPLTAAASTAMTGGNSGTTLSSGDHVNARAAFEADAGFSMFALDDFAALSSPEQIAYRDWTVRLVEEGKLFHLVVGGLANETVATAVARSATLDQPDSTHTAGMGDVIINTSRDLVIEGTTYSSSRLAPRVAGIIASADYNRSASGATVQSARLSNSPSAAQVEALVRGGVVPYINDGGVVRLDRVRTAYTAAVPAISTKAEEFRSVLFVRKLWHTFREMDRMVSSSLIGKPLVNTESTRETIIGMFEALLMDLEEAGVTIPRATVDLDPVQDNTGETLHLLFKYTPASGIEQVLAQVSVPV